MSSWFEVGTSSAALRDETIQSWFGHVLSWFFSELSRSHLFHADFSHLMSCVCRKHFVFGLIAKHWRTSWAQEEQRETRSRKPFFFFFCFVFSISIATRTIYGSSFDLTLSSKLGILSVNFFRSNPFKNRSLPASGYLIYSGVEIGSLGELLEGLWWTEGREMSTCWRNHEEPMVWQHKEISHHQAIVNASINCNSNTVSHTSQAMPRSNKH